MLYDKNFLLELDKQKNKNTYAKITSLTFDEFPIESIEGRISQGNINIDGNSALRRTCQLTILLDSYDYNNYDWSLHTKFKLEIGVENTVNQNYPEIIWFNQGIYLITSFSTSKTINNFTLSISGKDKMCLLNGDIGGVIEATTDFGQLEETIEESYVLRKIPIKEIINNLVSIYGKELKHNIIINDLDMPGLELLEYRYDTPMYLYKKASDKGYENVIIENDDYEVYSEEKGQNIQLKKLKDLDNSYFDLLINGLNGVSSPENKIYLKQDEVFVQYNFAKISYGQQAGYRETDLVYPGDLIANPGDSIVSVLDKIKNMFTEFEYFYDLDGRFVFQQKKSSLKTLWSKENPNNPIGLNKNLIDQNIDYYLFDNSELLISLNNTPDLLKIKNDFSIWGERESISGTKIPIHIRYAIDKKPDSYTSISVDYNPNGSNEEKGNDREIIESYNEKYNTNLTGQTSKKYIRNDKYKNNGDEIQCDWREIIYQMANDYYKYNFLPDFEDRVLQNNSTFIGGKTGYENYYSDIFGFWRDIYDPEIDNKIDTYESVASNIITTLENSQTKIKSIENGTIQPENGSKELTILQEEEKIKTFKKFGKEIIGWLVSTEKIFDALDTLQKNFKAFFTKQEIEKLDNELKEDPGLIRKLQEKDFLFYKEEAEKNGWLKDVFLCPENLVFWFDFLDTSGEISKNSVKNIGQRPIAVKDSQITSIYNRDTPDILFVEGIPNNPLDGYAYIKIPNIEEMFSVSAQGISAYNKLGEKLNEHSSFVETVSITALPIYYFEPGMIVQVTDKDTNLFGEYIVNKISFNLSYNGTMQLNGNKIIQDIVA